MPPIYQPPFTILVAGISQSSDPATGVNPTKSYSAMTIQTVITDGNTMTQGGPVAMPIPVSSTNYTASITVVSNQYWDPSVAPGPPPFYLEEEVNAGGYFLVAADDFGVGDGSGAAATTAIATALATAISAQPYMSAVAVASVVYINTSSPDPGMQVQATNDMSVILGSLVFTIKGPGAVTVATASNYRRTFVLSKVNPTQTAPILHP